MEFTLTLAFIRTHTQWTHSNAIICSFVPLFIRVLKFCAHFFHWFSLSLSACSLSLPSKIYYWTISVVPTPFYAYMNVCSIGVSLLNLLIYTCTIAIAHLSNSTNAKTLKINANRTKPDSGVSLADFLVEKCLHATYIITTAVAMECFVPTIVVAVEVFFFASNITCVCIGKIVKCIFRISVFGLSASWNVILNYSQTMEICLRPKNFMAASNCKKNGLCANGSVDLVWY